MKKGFFAYIRIRSLATFLMLAITMSFVPVFSTAAQAAVGVRMPGNITSAANLGGTQVYFGSYQSTPILWYAVSTDSDTITLWTTTKITDRRYHSSADHKNWSGSELCAWLNGTGSFSTSGFLPSAFKTGERSAIAQYGTTEVANPPQYINTNIDISQKIVLPSVAEMGHYYDTGSWNISYSYRTLGTGFGDSWWLRSPGASTSRAAMVDRNGNVASDGFTATTAFAVYPAFKLHVDSIFFASSASGGSAKSASTIGGGLVAATTTSGAVKLTIFDSAQATPIINFVGATNNTDALSFNYTGAAKGANQFISCILEQDGVVKYYGKLENCTSVTAGDFSVSLAGVSAGTYELKLFGEQANGNNLTDYASATTDFTLTVDGSNKGTISGVFIAPKIGSVTYTPALKLSDIALPTDYAWKTPETALAVPGDEYPATFFDGSKTHEGTIAVTVTKAEQVPLIISSDVADFYFGSAPFVPSVTGGTLDNTSTTYLFEGINGTDFTSSSDMPTAIGKYQIKATLAGNENYKAVTAGKQFSILANAGKNIARVFEQDITWNGTGTDSFPNTAALTIQNSVEALSETDFEFSDYASITFGKAENPVENDVVSLNIGSNAIYVIVTAQDGTKEYYVLTVTRASGGNSGGGLSDSNYTVTFEYREGGALLKREEASYLKNKKLTASDLKIPEGYELVDSTFTHTVTRAETISIEVVRIGAVPEPLDGESAYCEGYPNGTFNPDGQITRAEVVQMVYNLTGNNAETDLGILDKFSDMQEPHWAGTALAWATLNGYITGYEGGNLQPNAPISRAEMSALLHRIAIQEGLLDGLGAVSVQLSDIDGHWAHTDIISLATKGIIKGYIDGTFKPDNSVTRAETVAMCARLFERSDEFNTDKTFTDVPNTYWAYVYIMNAANGILK